MKQVMKRPGIPAIVLLASLIYLLAAGSGSLAGAADKPVLDQAGTGRTKITSRKLQYSHQGKQVTFEGDVHVDRPDFKLRSETLTVFFTGGDKDEAKPAGKAASPEMGMGGDQQIERIVAQGKVVLEKDGRIGHCTKATYQAKEGVIRLEGDPIIEDGKNMVQGQVILFYVNENRSVVEGDSLKPVEAVFYTGKELKETKDPKGKQK